MHDFILVLALLTTQSSYKSNIERPAIAVEDTVQFWFSPQGSWKIRTFAIDHDIHIHSLDLNANSKKFMQSDAEAHIAKFYGEILKKQYVITFKNPANLEDVKHILNQSKLTGTLEVASAGFAFYNPDAQKYKSQSMPK